MKAYVINMDHRPDKLEAFRMNKFPFEVERVPGIVASCGEDGCTQAHLQLLSRQTDFPFVVFEDDCEMLGDWNVIEEMMKQLPQDWDALWLGATLGRKLFKHSTNLYRLHNGYTTHAIIYNSKRMVDYILQKHNTPSGKNLDIFYAKELQYQFNCFITYPLMATQHPSVSDIGGAFVDHHDFIDRNFKKGTR